MYPFQFQIRALRPGIARAAICFRGEMGGIALPHDKEVTVELSTEYDVPWDVSFLPVGETFGEAAIRIYIGWQALGETEWRWMQASVRHRIYPAQSPAKDVARSLVFTIHNNTTVNGHANDVEVRDTVDKLEHFAQHVDPDNKAFALVDQMAAMRLFKTLRMLPSKPPSPPPALTEAPPVAPARARADALTLRRGDWCLHLIAKPVVRFGRHRDNNDLVARVYGADGQLNEALSILISKSHGCIEHQGNRCVVIDRSSSFRTALDNRLLAEGEAGLLLAAGRHQLTLAAKAKGAQNGTATTWELETWHCGGAAHWGCPLADNCQPSAPASLHIRRRDGLREDYLLVWRCAPLDKPLPDLAGARIYRLDGGFQLRRPGHAAQWIYPGLELPAPNGSVSVGAYAQLGLNKPQPTKGTP